MALAENQIRDNITKSVQNQIAQQRQSINNGLGLQKTAFDNSINQNKSYLDEQIKGLNTQRIQNDDNITTLQNRRGGFYSGGLDYQLANNLKSTQSSQNNITRDINSKNSEIQSQYNTLAGQAANQISLLEQQAPDKIRELVNAELDKQRQIKMQEDQWALEKQLKELQLQNARASASRGSSSGGGSSSRSSSPAKTSASNLSKQYSQYKAQKQPSKPVALQNLDSYYKSQESKVPLGKFSGLFQPVAPAQNKNLSAWEKMKMLGL